MNVCVCVCSGVMLCASCVSAKSVCVFFADCCVPCTSSDSTSGATAPLPKKGMVAKVRGKRSMRPLCLVCRAPSKSVDASSMCVPSASCPETRMPGCAVAMRR